VVTSPYSKCWLSFKFEKRDFVGVVGQSGAGESTIVSLLVRMYKPDAGEVRVNDRPIHRMDVDEWRSKVAVVRQNPFIFNDTLRYNLTIGNRDVSDTELDIVARIAKSTSSSTNYRTGTIHNSGTREFGCRGANGSGLR